MKKSIYWIIPLLMMFGLGLYGCADSLREGKGEIPSDVTGPEGSEDGEWISYTMEFNASDMITPSLRSLTEAEENDIKGNVRVLVFNTSDNKFEYEAPVTSVTPTGDKKAAGTVQLLLKHTDAAQYRFVMLANLPEGTPEANTFTGKSYDEVMKQFTYDMPENGAWKGGDLPMWGEITAVVNHNKGANPKVDGTIQLIRAVARIDVGLNLTTEGASQFNEKSNGLGDITMTSIKFYNMNDKGTVAPASSSLVENSTTKVKVPTIPNGVAALSPELNMTDAIQAEKLLQRSVYVPEAKNDPAKATQSGTETLPEADQANYMKRPYMVVGLKGACKNDKSKTTYFRIDFLKKDGDEATATYEYLPLLRNFRYLVNITNVGGPGFDKEEDAQKGPAANIMYNVVVWNESEMSNVKYDGQYMLGVSQDHFKFYRDGGTLTAKVKTSWPKGFTVENLPKWITYTVTPEGAGTETDEKIVTFKVTEHVTEDRTHPKRPGDAENPSEAAYVQAGRMRWFLHFEQSKDLNVTIQIFSDEACTKHLEFININQFGKAYGSSGKVLFQNGKELSKEEAGAIVTFYVKTEPSDIEPTFDTNDHDRFDIKKVAESGGGIWEYTVTASDITENDEYFDHIVSTYNFTITHDETGKMASTDLVLQQLEYNAIPFHDEKLYDSLLDQTEDYFYLMEGIERNFWVKGNTDYKIELVSAAANPPATGNVLEPFTPLEEHDPSLSGKPVFFTPVDDITNPTLFEGTATFKISSPMGLFPTREFSVLLISAIKQPEANTYMVKRGAKQGILIPVSRVNTAADYYDRLLDHDEAVLPSSKKPYPLPGNSANPYRLNRLDDDDDWTVNVVWTDINDRSKNTTLEKGGLKRLSHAGGRGAKNSYVLVQVGDTAGNVLIQIRSAKKDMRNPLWSWHIWIVDNYPTTQTIQWSVVKPLTGGSGHADKVELMSRLLGAFDDVSIASKNYDDDNWRLFGMMYQWGRKDPFPAYDVLVNKSFYDGEGNVFNFIASGKGDRGDKGKSDALEAAGSTYTMKKSIENPESIISHQSLWCYEQMPFRNVRYLYDKWVFRYPWNRVPSTGPLEENDHIDLHEGKTVFDPSPYGFRIMNYSEAITLRWAYDRYRQSQLKTILPGSIYDGDYLNNLTGGDEVIFAVAQSRDQIAGCYLLNSTGSDAGWTNESYLDHTYKRALPVSVRPVVDPEHYGAENLTEKDYKKYLPK